MADSISAPVISIQTEDFDPGSLCNHLAQGSATGAVVTFVGLVREFAGASPLAIQHYPGMVEKTLAAIIAEAELRWAVNAVHVVHRVGQLQPGDRIVFVGVGARHRKDAFHACEFIMDFLKTRAPFWKKEGDEWVTAKESDEQAAREWHE